MSIIKQVRATIREHHLFPFVETVVVGVSGGPDSLALLHVLRELSQELEIRLHVAHLNHGLRGDRSEADAQFVRETSGTLAIPFSVRTLDVLKFARERHLSVEEAARIVRYHFLADVARTVGARSIAVGHNADDQVETVMMHMLRGAGLAGLRGMTYVSPLPQDEARAEAVESPLRLVRPILDVTRSEIEAYCLALGLTPRVDESNLDTTWFRNRLRHEIIPHLKQLNPNLAEVVRHTATVLADDYEYLSEVTKAAFLQILDPAKGELPAPNLTSFVFDRERWRGLPASLQRATLREGVSRLRKGLRNINWAHIEDARRIALEKGVGSEATLPQGLVLVVGYGDITIGETYSLPDMPLLHGGEIDLPRSGTLFLPGSEWQVKLDERRHEGAEEDKVGPRGNTVERKDRVQNKWAVKLDADKISGRLVLRTRRSGERFEPKGMLGHHKSLHEFMIEEKIPRQVRDLLPILADEEKVLWVCGFRLDRRAKVSDQTERILMVEFFRHSEPD